MSSLRVLQVLSESKAFARRHRLRLPRADDVFSLGARIGDTGAFGEVHAAVVSDPRATEPSIAIKVLFESGDVSPRVAALHEALDRRRRDPDWPERLLALPYSVVLAEHGGEQREATFMINLAARGYELAKDHFGAARADEYRDRPPHQRAEFACSYAKGAALLESLPFLHGDQNPPNLMLNPTTLDAQILDLDAGAILETGRERSLAQGKGDYFVPPEVNVSDQGVRRVDKERWDIGAERWSVGSLVGYLALGFAPAFFLIRVTPRVIDAYAQQGPWPKVDLGSDLVRPEFEATYKYYRPLAEAAPGRVRETLVRFFRAGTRGDQRPSAQDWVEALEVARRKPTFEFLRVSPPVAPEGTEVVLSWNAEGADRVESQLLGELPPTGQRRVVAARTGRYRLTAVNFYGEVEAVTNVLRVVPLPRLTTIPLPEFPGLELQANITTAAPRQPAPLTPPRFSYAIGIPPAVPPVVRAPRPLPQAPSFGTLFGGPTR